MTVTTAIADRLPKAVEANAYFLIAEALTNAAKHARATGVGVSMSRDGNALVVEIRDDGIGGASMNTAGTGLRGMADRARALGGRLTIISPQRGGTLVRAAIPVDAAPTHDMSLRPRLAEAATAEPTRDHRQRCTHGSRCAGFSSGPHLDPKGPAIPPQSFSEK